MRDGRHRELHLFIIFVYLTRTNFFEATETLDYLEFGEVALAYVSDRLSFKNLVQINCICMLNYLCGEICLALGCASVLRKSFPHR